MSSVRARLSAILGFAAIALVASCEATTAPAPLVAAKLAFTDLGPNFVATKPITPNVVVVVLDKDGRPIPTATNSVTIALGSNAAGATLSGTTTVNAVGGVATFTNLVVDKPSAGYTLSASAQGLASATSPQFTVQPGGPASLEFVTPPGNGIAGVAIGPAITVAIKDITENLATNSSLPVVFQLRDANDNVVYSVTALASNGVATFSSVVVERAGTYIPRAQGANVATAIGSSITIGPAAPARLAFVGQPDGQPRLAEAIGTVGVAIQDRFENAVTTATNPVTIALSTNPRAAALSGTLTASAVAGVAQFTDLRVDKPASEYTLAASAPGLTSAISNLFEVTVYFANVSAGGGPEGSHSCGITDTGAALCWGANQYGQLGDNSTTPRLRPALVAAGALRFTAVSAGAQHSCGLTTAGDIYCWGDNRASQLGDGSATQRNAPVKVSGSTKYIAVSAGYTHTCALSTTGAAYCWGANPDGRLGDGSTSPHAQPAPVSGVLVFQKIASDSAHSCALAGAAAYCWGSNSWGQIGDNSQSNRSVPTPVSGGHAFGVISTGARHSCAVTTAGDEYYCWGNNSHQQTALQAQDTPRLTPQLGWASTFLHQIEDFSAGADFNCVAASFQLASIYGGCWGNNDSGQQGDARFEDLGGPSTLASPAPNDVWHISAGRAHGCLVSTSQQLWCWGANRSGELGDGTTTLRNTAVYVTP